MKQVFLKNTDSDRLILFFGGWGSSPELFSEHGIENGYDCLLCCDYRDLSFDRSLLDGYGSVRVIAWSMGVWAADRICRNTNGVNWEEATAFGGTLRPVDDDYGIPRAVFEGTLGNMSLSVLYKFRRRMCGGDLEYFERHLPARDIADLKEELECLGRLVTATEYDSHKNTSSGFAWTRAIAGERDLIFPFAGQIAAWRLEGLMAETVDAAHYDRGIFEALLQGKRHVSR